MKVHWSNELATVQASRSLKYGLLSNSDWDHLIEDFDKAGQGTPNKE